MNLENLSKEELLIREALIQSSNEKADKYLKKNKMIMDVKMYFALNQLYLNKDKKNTFN